MVNYYCFNLNGFLPFYILGIINTIPKVLKEVLNFLRLKFLTESIMSSIPILMLGALRLASVKLSGYHEHISEYGLHWNFFFTMASVKVIKLYYFRGQNMVIFTAF
jgi:hypothetical protein